MSSVTKKGDGAEEPPEDISKRSLLVGWLMLTSALTFSRVLRVSSDFFNDHHIFGFGG